MKSLSLKGSIERQRKETMKESVIQTFKGALLKGLMGDFKPTKDDVSKAEFVSPAKRRWKRTVKKIILQNAVAKVKKMLEKNNNVKGAQSISVNAMDQEPLRTVIQPISPSQENMKRGQKKRGRKTFSEIRIREGRTSGLPEQDIVDVDTTFQAHFNPRREANPKRVHKLQDIKDASIKIEREVVMSEKVIEAFHTAVSNSLSNGTKNESQYASHTPAKSRWKRSIKRIILQKAVSRVNDMLIDRSNRETHSKTPTVCKEKSLSSTDIKLSLSPSKVFRPDTPVAYNQHFLPPSSETVPSSVVTPPHSVNSRKDHPSNSTFRTLFHSQSNNPADPVRLINNTLNSNTCTGGSRRSFSDDNVNLFPLI